MYVFSFCLYGPSNPRYYPGLLENIDLVAQYFPDWKVYIYVAPDVDPDMIETLAARPTVVLRETNITGERNMIHRFYAIDEPEVDLMMVRDADSRIHWKDRWAIRDFLRRPHYHAHAIRDSPMHKSEMLGGLWGIRKSAGLNIRDLYSTYVQDMRAGPRNGHDQCFLTDVVYPLVRTGLLVHYSCGQFLRLEAAVEFPFEGWADDHYFCGAVVLGPFVDIPEPPAARRVVKTAVGPFAIPRRDTAEATHSVMYPPLTMAPPDPQLAALVTSTAYRSGSVPTIVNLLHRR
jgi:hypothetical protein